MRATCRRPLVLGFAALCLALWFVVEEVAMPADEGHERYTTMTDRRAVLDFALHHLSKNVSQLDVAGQEPENAAAACELYFLSNSACAAQTSMMACAMFHGCAQWSKALPQKCSESHFWKKNVLPHCGDGAQTQTSTAVDLLLDRVILSTMPRQLRQGYVPVHRRRFSTLAGPKNCSFGLVYRYGYFIPSANIVRSVVPKIWDWLEALPPVYPGVEPGIGAAPYPRVPFHFEADDELTYVLATMYSYFAWTIERTGVNTVRTMEILSQGSVPYYPDYDRCEVCLSQLPRHLLERALNLPGLAHIGRVPNKSTQLLPTNRFFFRHKGSLNVKDVGTIDWTTFNTTAYYSLAKELLNFTQNHLTCAAGMASLLKFIHFDEPTNILHIVRPNETLPGNNGVCGLAELGLNYTRNVATLEHRGMYVEGRQVTGKSFARNIFDEGINFMYAHGYSFSRRIDDPPNVPLPGGWDDDVDSCASHLRKGRFDLVMFAGTVPSPQTIPCYRALIKFLRSARTIKRFVILDVGDTPQQPNVTAQLVRDGAHVFAVNEPQC